MGLEIERVIMVASNDPGTSQHIAMPVGDGQEVGGLGFLATLIGHRLAAFLGNRMTAIQIDLFEVQIALNHLDAMLPDLFQAAIAAPFTLMMVNRLPTDFL